MNQERKALRVGVVAILCAIILRLGINGAFQPLVDLLRRPETAAFLFYLETGRVLRTNQPESEEAWARESPPPDFPAETVSPPEPAEFSPEDLGLVELYSSREEDPDLEALLLSPLNWNLTGPDPTVLILHTHATESYTKAPGEDYEETSDYRTPDPRYNMLSVGQALAEALKNRGISVLHDQTLHDAVSYNGAYTAARETVERYLAQYPSIQLVLDLHRDAADSGNGQLNTAADVDGQSSAQLMLVAGSDGGGYSHDRWQDNLSLALKLHVLLEKDNPGLCRHLCLRNSRYNQDLSPGMLLVEVGAAGDTRQEALTAVQALAEGILALSGGGIKADSTS